MRNNVFSTGSNGTINELVIVRINRDHPPPVEVRYHLHIGSILNNLHNHRSEVLPHMPVDNFFVLHQNIRSHTENYSFVDKANIRLNSELLGSETGTSLLSSHALSSANANRVYASSARLSQAADSFRQALKAL